MASILRRGEVFDVALLFPNLCAAARGAARRRLPPAAALLPYRHGCCV